MHEFTQAQAAVLTGYSERDFRSRVDKRIFLPTPETRMTGRGKAKSFDRHEVKVASILRKIAYGLRPYQEAEIADWLRREVANVQRASTDSHPSYVLLEASEGGWRGRFETARGRSDFINGEHTESADRRISVMFKGDDGVETPANSFFAANINAALWWDDDKFLADFFKPEPTNNSDAEDDASE